MSKSILMILALGWVGAHADLTWNFAQADNRPGGTGGIYAYAYPSDSVSHHTAAHTASLGRIADATGNAAKLSFVLDGTKYPSAGFGLMFSESQPLDLRGLASIRLYLSADKARKVRVAFASRIPAYKAAFDTGVSFGRDLKAGANGATFTIPVGDIAYPPWATEDDYPSASAVSNSDILASTWAIQFSVSCESASGTCSQDSGWIRLDSLRLVGVGTDWQPPAPGSCVGDSIDLSKFNNSVPKRNGLGGWWYAYTDLSSADTAAQGESRILSAPDTSNPGSWIPDSLGNQANLAFHLLRKGSYSGYADLETQFGAPDAGHTVAVSIPGLKAISFQLAFDSSFSPSLGGVTLHAKKAGKAYSEGKDHQIRIPYDSLPHRWCLDFDSLHQPSWASWVPFTPDSLLALSWEVKLQGNSAEAIGGVVLRDIKLWSASVGIRARQTSVWTMRRTGAMLELTRPAGGGAVVGELVDAGGRILDRSTGGGEVAGLMLRIPSARGMLWVRTRDDRGVWSKAISPVP